MYDDIFEEIKSAFLTSFSKCIVENQKTRLLVIFDNKIDADWFHSNVVYPKHPVKSPVHFVSHLSPVGGKIQNSLIKYEYAFKVNDKDKLIELLK